MPEGAAERGNGSHGQKPVLTPYVSSSEFTLRIRDGLRARREGADRHRQRRQNTHWERRTEGRHEGRLSEDGHSRGAQHRWSSGKHRLSPPTTTTAADKTMARPWSRGAVGQPPRPHDDGVTGLWNSSSEPPARHRTLEMLSERTASPPEPGHRSDGPGAPRLPGTAAHLAATSKAAEHGVPPARSPCAVLVFGLRGRHNFSNFIR